MSLPTITRSSLILALATFTASLTAAGVQDARTQSDKRAEEVYTNIDAMRGLPADAVNPTMAMISASLGVECTYCHVADKYDLDEKRPKDVARFMITLTRQVNQTFFSAQAGVSCNTCHQGRAKPPLVAGAVMSAAAGHVDASAAGAPLPGIDAVLSKYVAAAGGADGWQKIASLVRTGAVWNATGPIGLIEQWTRGADRSVTILTYKPAVGTVYTGLNGDAGWSVEKSKRTAMTPAEFARERRALLIARPSRLKEAYDRLEVIGRESIGGTPCHVVKAEAAGHPTERLFFGVEDGLLRRRERIIETPLGNYAEAIELGDYRDVQGVRVPMTEVWFLPEAVTWRRYTEARANVTIPDDRFAPPPAATALSAQQP
jgi:hypothetical protein